MNRSMQKRLVLSKPQRRVLMAMQMRGADLKHDRVEIVAAFSTLFTLKDFGLVDHAPGNSEIWWLTERGRRVQP